MADDLLVASRFLCLHSYHLHPSWGDIVDHFPTFDELRITGVILMLRSMALECLLKALYVKHCGPLAVSGRYKRITKNNEHDLEQLAKLVSDAKPLGLSDQQVDYLRRAALNTIRGRYPVHIDWTKHLKHHASGNRRRSKFMAQDQDDELFQSTCKLLRGFLAEEVKAMYADAESSAEDKRP